MSQSRQERRNPTTPPPTKKGDPMRAIYIGIAVLVVAIFAAFGIARWNQQHQLDVAWATPTPLPSSVPTSKPIQVSETDVIGKSAFPQGNTAAGGHGSPVDGVECGAMEFNALHIHTHLAIVNHGKQVAIPMLVGGVPQGNTGCLYWIHTHNQSGVIHVEAPQIHNPSTGGPYTLGNFFDIWGQPLTRNQVATFNGPVTAYVNGAKYDGELKDIPLLAHQRVVLEVGTPLIDPPPNYLLPEGD